MVKKSDKDSVVAVTKRKVDRRVKSDYKTDDVSDEEILERHLFVTTPAVAKARLGLTMSRNYQSVTLAVEYEIPCYKEEVTEAGEKAFRMAKEHIASELPELREFLEGVKDL